MANKLLPTIRGYLQNDAAVYKRYIRPDDAAKEYQMSEEKILVFASAAGAVYRLPRITLICHRKLENYMKHIYKVPNSGKQVIKKFARIGEGSIIYSIGRHRFIEMARAAGSVYKVNGTVLINLEIFDEYMEQFREAPIEMKNPLWKPEKQEG